MSTTPPLFSVVIPVYNGDNYLKQAIDSVLIQEYPNIEIIVVNDGSKDEGKTEELALSYGNKIKYIHKENGGVSSALNLGIEAMSGEYFIWLSHDDMLTKNRVQGDYDFFKLSDKHKVLLSNQEYINGKGEITKKEQSPNSDKLVLTTCEDYYRSPVNVNFCSLTLHKSVLDKVGLFNTVHKYSQDVIKIFEVLIHFNIYYTGKLGISKRKHEEQGSYSVEVRNEARNMIGNFISENLSYKNFTPELSPQEGFKKFGDIFYYRMENYEEAKKFYKLSLEEFKTQKEKINFSLYIHYQRPLSKIINKAQVLLYKSRLKLSKK